MKIGGYILLFVINYLLINCIFERKNMTARLLPFITACFFLGCSQSYDRSLLNSAQSLFFSHPDSSLSLLNIINPNNLKQAGDRARYALYLSAALDKNYIDVDSDSLISIATEYFCTKGPSREQMMAWYYHGIVQKNMSAYSSAVVSFEKAATIAKELCDTHYLGLIYRNIASSFDQTNNIDAAIDYYSKSIKSFKTNPEDSLYLQYAYCSLATAYYTNGDYDKAIDSINQIKNTSDNNLLTLTDLLFARICFLSQKDYKTVLNLYKLIPLRYLLFEDYANYSLAYSYLGYNDSSDFWLKKAYSKARNEPDSATIDYTKSLIMLKRGKTEEAYSLLRHATMVQDSLTRVLLSESISAAQRDYFKEEARTKEEHLSEVKKRGLLLGIIGLLITMFLLSALALHSLKKNQALKELMAQLAVNNNKVIELSQNNATLLATHYSERIKQIDNISQEYYQADSNNKKDIVFKQFKDYIGELNNNDSLYKTIEEDLNHYCSDLMTRFREQVPMIKGRNIKLISLFFAGLSYETVAIITNAQSINSLKTQRSRLRAIIEESDATDKEFFLKMLEMKRQQARKTNDD